MTNFESCQERTHRSWPKHKGLLSTNNKPLLAMTALPSPPPFIQLRNSGRLRNH